MQHRNEIDGLRAVAVIPVIFFHAGYNAFSGGFVGVDVFFVISGYLITSIIIRELDNGEFSIARFYERRARRILPALLVVMIVCLPFAWMWMMPEQFEDFSESLAATSLFVSNILFWQEAGYFAVVAEEKPLLHTWSLAVEEQYYVLFPIFAILIWRYGRDRLLLSIVLVAVASFFLSEWGAQRAASLNFYFAATRAWEICGGAICAFLQYRRSEEANNALSVAGLILIAVAVFWYDRHTPSPSAYTILPVAGTALVILYGGAGTVTARLLSTPALVGIGLISYSAYLWHQPFFAFARINSVYPSSEEHAEILIALSFLMAYITWRFIEKPFRNPGIIKRKNLLWSVVPVTAGLIFIGLIFNISPLHNGYYYYVGRDLAREDYQCRRVKQYCYFGDEAARHGSVLLLGNSHARMLVPNLGEAFEESGVLGVHPWRENADDLLVSKEYPAEVIEKWRVRTCALAHQAVATVVGYRWSKAITGLSNYIRFSGGRPLNEQDAIVARLRNRLEQIAQCSNRLFLVGPVPEAPVVVPRQLHLFRIRADFEPEYGTSQQMHKAENKIAASMLRSLSERYDNTEYIDAIRLLCQGGSCPLYREIRGRLVPLYYDDTHLTPVGSKVITDLIADRILSGPHSGN